LQRFRRAGRSHQFARELVDPATMLLEQLVDHLTQLQRLVTPRAANCSMLLPLRSNCPIRFCQISRVRLAIRPESRTRARRARRPIPDGYVWASEVSQSTSNRHGTNVDESRP